VLNRAIARVRAHDARRVEQRRRSFGEEGELLVVDTQTSISEAAPSGGERGASGSSAGAVEAAAAEEEEAEAAEALPLLGQQQQQHDSEQPKQQQIPMQTQQQQHQQQQQQQQQPARLMPPLSPQLSLDEWMCVEAAGSGQSPHWLSRSAATRTRRRSTNNSASSGAPANPAAAAAPPLSSACRRGLLHSTAITSLPIAEGCIAAATDGADLPCDLTAAGAEGSVDGSLAAANSSGVPEPPIYPASLFASPGYRSSSDGAGDAASASDVTLSCGSRGDRDGRVVTPVTPRLGRQRSGAAFSDALDSAEEDNAAFSAAAIGAAAPAGSDEPQAASLGHAAAATWSSSAGAASCHTPQHLAHAVEALASAEFSGFEFPSPDRCTQHGADAPGGATSGGLGAGVTAGRGAISMHAPLRHAAADHADDDTAPDSPPEMPLVVLNGMAHEPGVAVSILDIWRSADLEELGDLPRITDFEPARVVIAPAAREGSLEQPQGPGGVDRMWGRASREPERAQHQQPRDSEGWGGHQQRQQQQQQGQPPQRPTQERRQHEQQARGQRQEAPSAAAGDWDTSL